MMCSKGTETNLNDLGTNESVDANSNTIRTSKHVIEQMKIFFLITLLLTLPGSISELQCSRVQSVATRFHTPSQSLDKVDLFFSLVTTIACFRVENNPLIFSERQPCC